MDVKNNAEEIIFAKDNFPRMLKKTEGEIVKRYFDLDGNFHGRDEEKGNIERRYTKIINNHKYLLLEEYLFRENEATVDINKAIGVNYYISRKN